MNMKLRYMTIPVLAVLITAAGCSEKPGQELLLSGDHELTIAATGYRLQASSGTKSLVDLSKDQIYAYPFSLDVALGLTGAQIAPSSINDNMFTYLMPEPTEDVIFSNLYEGIKGWTYTTGSSAPLLTVSASDNTGSDNDFVAGFLPESSMDSDTTVFPVDLRRKAARLSVNLQAKASGSEELIADLSSLFSSVTLSVNTYESYIVNSVTLDGTGETYSGETVMTWENSSIPAGETATLVYERFILPATSPVLTLTLTSPSGYQKTLEATMNQTISANRNYNLTLTLRQSGSGFDFNIDSFTEQDMDIEFGRDDLVTLSVAPSMLSIDMDTKAGEGDTYDGFVLGRDDLYLYCFSAQTDSLIHGYPIKQTTVNADSTYTFRLPPPYALALNLCHVAEQLQNDVGYERACDPGRRPARRPRVEQGHIENRDVGADIVREMAPLVENIGVASPQTIDARYHEEISAREVAHHALPLRTLKRGARKVIDIDVLFGNRKRPQRVQLPVYVLVARGYARIAKRRHRFHLFAPARRGIYTNICTIERGADTYTKKRDLPTGTTRYSG